MTDTDNTHTRTTLAMLRAAERIEELEAEEDDDE